MLAMHLQPLGNLGVYAKTTKIGTQLPIADYMGYCNVLIQPLLWKARNGRKVLLENLLVIVMQHIQSAPAVATCPA